jgi:hypothetical protein
VLEAVGLRAPVRRPYSAPERVAGEKWGAPADVYSLAAIGYELLTGRRIAGPVTGPEALELRPADPLVSRLLAGPLARALAEDPADRYPGALAFARALEAAAEGEEERQIVPVADIPKEPRVRKSPEVPKVQPSLVDALDEATSAEASVAKVVAAESPAPRAEPKFRVFEKKPEAKVEPKPEPKPEPAIAEPKRELVPPPPVEPDIVVASRPEPPVDGVLDRPLERGLDRESPPDLALTPPPREPRAPFEPFEPVEPIESLEPIEPIEPAFHDREPMRVLPLAVMLVAGLLVGFVAGYAVGTRNESAAAGSAAAQPAGAAWSEAKVDPPAAPTPAPASAEPPAAEPSAAAAPAPGPGSVATRGTIVVRSTPARAGVIVDGVWRGRTPLTLSDLTLGRHTVRVAERGYTSENREVTLSAAQTSQDIDVRLASTPTSTTGSTRPAPAPARARPQPAPRPPARPAPAAERSAESSTQYMGSLYVDSRPRGARVFVDGRAVGVTPLQLGGIPVGARVIRLELPNHRSWTDSRRVVAGETTRVTGSLDPIQ